MSQTIKEVKSIGLNCGSEKERLQFIKTMNKKVLPFLKTKHQLNEATILEMQQTSVMSLLQFKEKSTNLNLVDCISLFCKQDGLDITEMNLIERHHPILA